MQGIRHFGTLFRPELFLRVLKCPIAQVDSLWYNGVAVDMDRRNRGVGPVWAVTNKATGRFGHLE